MKNIIVYYYNLKVNDIHQRENIFYFYIDNVKYVLVPYQKDLNIIGDIYELNMKLLNFGIPVHRIILNVSGQILTYINNEYYVLMEITSEKYVTVQDLLFLNSFMFDSSNNLKRNSWSFMWSEKNDYLEYQISQFGKKFPLIRKSFSYYLGMAETCISLINDIDLTNIPLYLNHLRIEKNFTVYDLYNPLNLILDYKVRDIAEYFKSLFFYDKNIKKSSYDSVSSNVNLIYEDDFEMLINQFFNNNLIYEEWVLFFVRMLYPSYYFDKYEEIINGKCDEKEIEEIICKHEKYEKLLIYIYSRLRNFPDFPIIDYFEYKKNVVI